MERRRCPISARLVEVPGLASRRPGRAVRRPQRRIRGRHEAAVVLARLAAVHLLAKHLRRQCRVANTNPGVPPWAQRGELHAAVSLIQRASAKTAGNWARVHWHRAGLARAVQSLVMGTASAAAAHPHDLLARHACGPCRQRAPGRTGRRGAGRGGGVARVRIRAGINLFAKHAEHGVRVRRAPHRARHGRGRRRISVQARRLPRARKLTVLCRPAAPCAGCRQSWAGCDA